MKIINKKAICFLFFLLYSVTDLNAQNIGDWNVYSSLSTVNDLSFSTNDDFYAITQGGIFNVQMNTIESRITTINGMHRLEGVKSVYDQINQQLIIAYSDGTIDLLDSNKTKFRRIDDISRVTEFTSKTINDLYINNGELIVSTDFGIVIFELSTFLVKNTYLSLADYGRGMKINSTKVEDDTMYVATAGGIAIGPLSLNLLDSNNWESIQNNGSQSNEVVNVSRMNDRLFIISNDSLFYSDQDAWIHLNSNLIREPISLEEHQGEIYVATNSRISKINSALLVEEVIEIDYATIRSFTVGNEKILIGTNEAGVIELDLNSLNEIQYLPSGPYLNFFSDLEFDDDILIASATNQFPQSDPFNPIRGYYIYRDGSWENYNRNTNSTIQDFRFSTGYTVEITEDNFFIGSWGDGVAIQSRTSNEIQIFDNSNSGISGISANRDFVVISGLDSDSKGNTWAISFISNFPLNMYSGSTGEWSHFSSLPIDSDELYFRIFIDSNDKIWIPLIDIENNGEGLLVIDPGNDLTSAEDDTFRKLTTGENSGNLPDNNVISIIEDLNGEVWIGTTRGIARFIFPDFIVNATNTSEFTSQWLINADTSAVSRFLLRDVNVSAIAANSANQKWIGSTNQGLWLLNEDGSTIIERFTKENSPLISDNIIDITVNDRTGEVFVSTDLGLVSFIETSIRPTTKMNELKVFPNPFLYERHDEIIIEDLTDQTHIKVMGADGSVFHELESRGGRISWSGFDSYGNKLASGVYFLVAIEPNGSEKGIGKVVIIN